MKGTSRTHSSRMSSKSIPEYQFLSAPLPPLPFVVPTAAITVSNAVTAMSSPLPINSRCPL